MKRNFSKTAEINGRECLAHYIQLLEEKCSDYKEIKSAFEQACRELLKESAHTNELIEYTNCMLAVSLEFSYRLGLEHNLANFKCPEAPTFLDGDYATAMDEKGLHKNPDYIKAADEWQRTMDQLPKDSAELQDKIFEYIAFMETYIPKIAHFYGFVAGNTVFKESVKDYEPDVNLTSKYKSWLSEYLDIDLE